MIDLLNRSRINYVSMSLSVPDDHQPADRRDAQKFGMLYHEFPSTRKAQRKRDEGRGFGMFPNLVERHAASVVHELCECT